MLICRRTSSPSAIKLTAHLKDVDDTNVTEAQMAITTELTETIKRGDEQLASLKEAEKQLALRSGDDDATNGDQ